VERTAFAQDGARLAPVYAEQTQTVEQLAAGAAVLFAQVEVEVTLFGRRFQAQTLL
jgi:phage protein D